MTGQSNMGVCGKSLVEFVRSARRSYDACRPQKVVDLVIGNSGGDMDSVVSALGYSYLSYLRGRGAETVVFPVLSFAREDLKLRRDIEHSLHAVGLREEDLIFADELERHGHAATEYRVRLVDHNDVDNAFLRRAVEQQRARVVAVIDHHADVGKYLDSDPRIVRPCGSCSTLVFQHFRQEFAAHYDGDGDGDDAAAAAERRRELEFLVTAIAIDTDCLRHRVEPPDTEVYAELFAPVLDAGQPSSSATTSATTVHPVLDRIGATAKAAKLDIEGLSMADLLRKDYKEYDVAGGDDRRDGGRAVRMGISSVACSFERLHQLYGAAAVEDAVARWMERRQMQLCVVMTAFQDAAGASGKKIFRRELALAPPHGLSDSALRCLKRQLQLEPAAAGVGADARLARYEQRDVAQSRKAVAPLLVSLLQQQ